MDHCSKAFGIVFEFKLITHLLGQSVTQDLQMGFSRPKAAQPGRTAS
jgi:hypothetical protein